MVYKLIRVAVLFALFLTVMTPALVAYASTFQSSVIGDLSSAISQFFSATGSFFQNVHGLINQFLLRGIGAPAVAVFNVMIHVSLVVPVFALSARLLVFLRRELS